MGVLHVPSFAGGVVLVGSPDATRTDELVECEGFDIGPRGQLVLASDHSDYLLLKDNGGGPATWARLYHVSGTPGFNFSKVLAVGEGENGGTQKYVMTTFARAGEATPFLWASGGSQFGLSATGGSPPVPVAQGVIITTALFPGQFWIRNPAAAAEPRSFHFVCIGAREGFAPNTAPGLYALSVVGGGTVPAPNGIFRYDSLGTGESGSLFVPTANGGEGGGANGTKGKPLYFRGIVVYNGHLFGWGYDSKDSVAGDGPSRVMFSNLNNPLKFGNDPGPSGTDRAFVDSDAIVLGGKAKIVRAGLVWAGKLWLGTNGGLHFIEGFGRQSFLTNGAIPVRGSRAVIGPHALIEGPDTLMYGIGPNTGLWVFNGGDSLTPGEKLVSFDGKSNGWWDLIWTDTSRTLASYPGQTNTDLVWMMSDHETQQVWIVIPFCNAAAGYGYGTDTVVIKYHTRTGAFTKQTFNVPLTYGSVIPRDTLGDRVIVLAEQSGNSNIRRYRYKATPASSPVVAGSGAVPGFRTIEYAPFGPNGVGVFNRSYVTIAWESGALPLILMATMWVDGYSDGSQYVNIGDTTPSLLLQPVTWVDTSLSDASLGNGTAGSFVASRPSYLVKRYVASWAKWVQQGGGPAGNRITIPLVLNAPRPGTRLQLKLESVSWPGRFQIEGFAEDPELIRSAR